MNPDEIQKILILLSHTACSYSSFHSFKSQEQVNITHNEEGQNKQFIEHRKPSQQKRGKSNLFLSNISFDPIAPIYAAVQNYNCRIIKRFHNI
jgi:hypothetical protein